MDNMLAKEEIDAIVDGNHGNVFAVLGIHRDKGSKKIFIRVFNPFAAEIEIIDTNGKSLGKMTKVDERGLFQINFDKTADFAYKLKITNDKGNVYIAHDIYRFASSIGDIDEYLFAQGNHREIYKKLGAHLTEIDGVKGVAFAVWAPNAKRVSVVGNFNNWDGRVNVMRKHISCGVWDIFVPDLVEGEYYKFERGVYVKYTISENTAVLDTRNNFTNYVESTKISGLQDVWQLDNHKIQEDLTIYRNDIQSAGPYVENTYNIYPTYCCLPPDLFYGCAKDCNLSNVFADTNIIGVIPQHLLKNCYNSKLENMFKNVNILPNLIYHYNSKTIDAGYLSLIRDIEIDNNTIMITNEDDTRYYNLVGSTDDDAVVLFRNGNGELRRRYPIDGEEYNKSQFAYVPQGYTTNQNLNSAFTFRYNLPAQVDLETSKLAEDGITWPTAPDNKYDTEYSPEIHPELWPYHTQYFFMTEESVSWTRLIYMSDPFISDSQDRDYSSGQLRVFSSSDRMYNNKWWSDYDDVIPSRWDGQTDGLLNIFLNLCGKRNIRTGKISDNGCTISKSMNNYPQLSSFISGTLVVLLNGKVFDDGLDAGRFTNLNGSSNIIQYTIGFGRNITLPQINYTVSDISQHSKILLQFNADNVLFYEYMFVNDSSLDKYKLIYTSLKNKVKTESGRFKYKVR